MNTWENQRKITDEREYEVEKRSAKNGLKPNINNIMF
jgi:hypothetical protein